MIFTPLPLTGAYLIELEKKQDQRGFFARCYCEREFAEQGLETQWVQMNTTLTLKKGTVRGLHYQREPKAEDKIVRCLRGAVLDVIVDLRKKSEGYGRWHAVELNDSNRNMLYVPKGFAHGFQTLTDDVEMLYMHSEFYEPGYEGGVKYDDPGLGIDWPLDVTDISERDKDLPFLTE